MHQQFFQPICEGLEVPKQLGPGRASGRDKAGRTGVQPLIPQGAQYGDSDHAQKRSPRQPGKIEPATQHHCCVHDQLGETLNRPRDPTDIIRQGDKNIGGPSLLGTTQRGPQDLCTERQREIQNRVLGKSDEQELGPQV